MRQDDGSWRYAFPDGAAEKGSLASVAARNQKTKPRLVDPTTCERDYSADDVEFMNAMQHYKQSTGRLFPTWSEALSVLRSLGYEKLASAAREAS